MHITTAVLTALAAARAIAAPSNVGSHRLHEKREYVPEIWSKGNLVPGNTNLPVRIGMTQQNLDNGHDLLMEV